MELCLLKFASSFNLALPEGKVYWFHESGRIVAVRTTTKQGALIFSYEKGHTEWMNETTSIHHSQTDDPSQCRVLSFNIAEPIQDLKGGLIDEIDYTVFDVIFEDVAGHFANNLGVYKDWATHVIQGFLNTYRLAMNRGWIGEFGRPLRPQIVLAATASQYMFEFEKLDATFVFLTKLAFDVRHPSLSGRDIVPPNEEQLRAFKERLKCGDSPALHEMILMEAAVQNVRLGNYDLSIIHIETAFEVFLQNLLIAQCSKNATRVLPTNKATKFGNQTAIEEGNIQGDLLRFVDFFTGGTVKTGAEYHNWYNDAYLKRNAIVHRGMRGSSEADVTKACDSTNAFMSHLKALLT